MARPGPEQAAVPVAVQTDLVSFVGDPGGELRSPSDLLAGEEEGRLQAGGVPSGCGPSSKVSATPSAIRSRTLNRRRDAGTPAVIEGTR